VRGGRLWLLGLLLPPLVSPWLDGGDAAWRAQLSRWLAPRLTPADPVVLAIDRESLQLEQLLTAAERRQSPLWPQMGSWPWSRALQAELAAAVLERGAAGVVFNLQFSQPSRFGPQDDAAFQRRLAPWWDRLVLAAAVERSTTGPGEQAQLRLPIFATAKVGLSNLLQSPQGLVQAIPGTDWIDRTLQDFPSPHPPSLAHAARGQLPPRGALGIRYPGPARVLRQVPAWQVLEQPPGFWRGRLVLIGATAPQLGDQQETPFGAQSGTEVQAAALATLVRGDPFRLPSPLALALLWPAWLALTAALLAWRRQATATILATGGLVALALLLVSVSWWAGWWLPGMALLGCPLLAGGLRAAVQWRRESGERAYLHQLLARRISPTLLQDILREPGPLWTQVGGCRARCAVLFTDLVGFTPLSAQLEPSALFTLLNRYFEVTAAAVLDHQGLLDKFIGDAVMAEFGVPRSRGDRQEALAAVRAALQMQDQLARLNAELVERQLPPLRQGIGIHFGEVVAGNLGSSERLEYSVIGATVNVASRVEGLTRQFPQAPILITAAVRDLLGDQIVVEPLGAQRIKGWPDPIDIFALRGLRVEGASPTANS
jgi:adenylate cyclase